MPIDPSMMMPMGGEPLPPEMMDQGMDVMVPQEMPPQLPDNVHNIEMMPLDDGGMMVDFEPSTQMMPPMDLPHGANLAEFIPEEQLRPLASELIDLYEEDKESRSAWLQSFAEGLDLLGTSNEERTEPFEGATGVHHPLLAEAATQFQAQAYKELLPAGGPVSVTTVGANPPQQQGPGAPPPPPGASLTDQAQRVKEFMNYQITNVMEEYDPELDQMLFYLPLSGSAFKKVYYDGALDRAVSKFVTAEDLVVNYTATDLKSAPRVTHVVRMSENDVRKQQVIGFYKDVELAAPSEESESPLEQKINEIQGTTRSAVGNEEYCLLEMHVDLDIPGFEDIYPETGDPTGIALPYVVTVVEDTSQIVSIRRNWEENNPSKSKKDYFVQYKFLPGLGFYGFGLIHMIGGLSKSATSILRQLVDAGTLANLPAGFKARGLRVSNEEEPIAPGEWRDVDAPGATLRESLMPLPYKEPSAVLFQLLGMLVESGRRFAAIADMAVSETGSQQNPVGTTLALLERGTKVMSAIHKRLHYAQRKEFQLLSKVFAESLPPEYPYMVAGGDATIFQSDFDNRVDVIPVSDPNIFSMSQRVMMATQQLQMAQAAPEVHNLKEAYRRMYQALEVKDIDAILPAEEQPRPMTPAQEHAQALQGKKLQAFPGQDHESHIAAHIIFAQNPMVQGMPEFYSNILQDIMQHISFLAQEQVEQEAQQMTMQMQQQMPPEMQQGPPQLPPELQQQMVKRAAQVEAQLIGEISQQLSPQQPDPMKEMHDTEMQVKLQTEAQKSQDAQARIAADLDRASMTEETKRLNIAAEQEKANQDTAQKREAAHLQATQKAAGIYQKAVADAEKADVARAKNQVPAQNRG